MESVALVDLGLGLGRRAVAAFQQYGYAALFAFMFLETSLLFPFIPSEVAVPVAAALLVGSTVALLPFVLVAAAGATAGSLVAYRLFGEAGAAAVERYGRYVHVSESDVHRAQRWFDRWGTHSVFWGRLLPGLRSLISVPAGFARMDVTRFALYTAAGSGIFAAAVGGLVYYGRTRSVYAAVGAAAGRYLDAVGWPAVALAVVALVGVGGWLWIRRTEPEST